MQEASFYLFKKKTCAPERINAPGALSRLSLQSAKGEHTLSLCRLERKTRYRTRRIYALGCASFFKNEYKSACSYLFPVTYAVIYVQANSFAAAGKKCALYTLMVF